MIYIVTYTGYAPDWLSLGLDCHLQKEILNLKEKCSIKRKQCRDLDFIRAGHNVLLVKGLEYFILKTSSFYEDENEIESSRFYIILQLRTDG